MRGAGLYVDLLDHGYLQIVESWGSDQRIIEADRMSTDKGFLGWGGAACPECESCGRLGYDGLFLNFDRLNEAKSCVTCKGEGVTRGDEKLLRYLYENKHATPFEFAGLVIEVQAPILVFREWHRHRTQSYNEMSARYTPLPDLNYRPTVDRCIVVPGTNKQAMGTSTKVPTHEQVLTWLEHLDQSYRLSQEVYQEGLEIGIPKEIARCPVPVARYSRMRASANLRNWIGFLTLRMDPAAQWEIRQFANAVGECIRQRFPRTWELFAPTVKR